MKKLLLLLIILTCVRCSRPDDEVYFNGEIIDVDIENVTVHQVAAQQGILSDLTFMFEPVICDNLMIGQHSNQNFIFSVIDISTGESRGNFVIKGNARNELISPSILKEVFVEDNQMKALIMDIVKRRMYKWNITKSLEKGSAQFDYITDIESSTTSFNYLFFTQYDQTSILTYSPAANKSLLQAQKCPELPMIEIASDNLSERVKKYSLYNKTYNYTGSDVDADIFFYCDTNIHPDRDYIVQPMWFLPQVNILDLKSGVVKGFRLPQDLDFSIFRTPSQLTNWYFCGGVCTTKDNIYIGYKGAENPRSRDVYEFNWQGELLNIYHIDIEFDKIIYDSITQKLYAYQMDTGSLFLLEI